MLESFFRSDFIAETCYLGKKIKTSIAMDEDLLKWIDKQIQTKRFASRTHAIEFAIEQLKKT
jgi:Arc/MetJ-type ribon-helix-helix transcriptional regulator